MKIITKKELLEREGWTEDKISFFLGQELYLKDCNGYVLSRVSRTESSPIFEKFTTIEDIKNLKENIELSIKNNTLEAMARFLEVKPHVPESISLLKQLNKYEKNGILAKEIIHWIQKDNLDVNDKYELFTDGSLKVEGNKNIIGCSGWIRNQNGDPILEFTKNIDENLVSSSYDFEIFGLEIGLKIAQSIGIKNLNVYADSSGEMRALTYMKEGFINERMVDLAEIYLPIQEIIKNMNISFSYIPRDYNNYADSLSKVYTEENKKYLKTVLEKQRKNGYESSINDSQYYTNYKIDSKVDNALETDKEEILFVQRYVEKNFYQFYIDMKTKEIISVEVLPLKEIKKRLIEEKMIFKEDSTGLDGIQLALMIKEIERNTTKGNKNINIVHPSLGIKCRIENIVMVTNDWKENYLMLDKAINKTEKVSFYPLNSDLMKITKKWMTNNNIKDNNKNFVKP